MNVHIENKMFSYYELYTNTFACIFSWYSRISSFTLMTLRSTSKTRLHFCTWQKSMMSPGWSPSVEISLNQTLAQKMSSVCCSVRMLWEKLAFLHKHANFYEGKAISICSMIFFSKKLSSISNQLFFQYFLLHLIIFRNISYVIHEEDFLQLSADELCHIFASDELVVSESELFNAALQ